MSHLAGCAALFPPTSKTHYTLRTWRHTTHKREMGKSINSIFSCCQVRPFCQGCVNDAQRQSLLTLCAVASELGGCFVIFKRQKLFSKMFQASQKLSVFVLAAFVHHCFYLDINTIASLNQQQHKTSPHVFKPRSPKASICFETSE